MPSDKKQKERDVKAISKILKSWPAERVSLIADLFSLHEVSQNKFRGPLDSEPLVDTASPKAKH